MAKIISNMGGAPPRMRRSPSRYWFMHGTPSPSKSINKDWSSRSLGDLRNWESSVREREREREELKGSGEGNWVSKLAETKENFRLSAVREDSDRGDSPESAGVEETSDVAVNLWPSIRNLLNRSRWSNSLRFLKSHPIGSHFSRQLEKAR